MFTINTLKEVRIKNIVFVTIFTALAVISPAILHVTFGPIAGRLFLPLHFFVFAAALLLGWRAGLAVGLLAPLISFSLTGMPVIAVLPLITIETIFYGFLAGYFFKTRKWNIVLSTAGAMISGRILLWTLIAILPLKMTATAFVLSATKAGAIGIAIQLILLPPIHKILEKYISDERI